MPSSTEAPAPLWQLGAQALHAGFRDGRFDPVDVIEAVLGRVAQCEPLVRATVTIDAAAARRDAAASALRWRLGAPLSAMDGVPGTVKDNLHVAGWPTTWGSRLLRDVVPTADEAPVARLRAAGAVLFAKTNLPEFAIQGFTDNDVVGATRNPWDLQRSPGGSSGGAAAAVACGYGPFALVTDGGGSARRPASHCGVVGFKPSAGRLARSGGLPDLFAGYEEAAWIGRSVADVRLVQGVLDPAPEAAPARLRILFAPRFGDHPVDPDIARAVAEAAETFATLGHRVQTADAFRGAEAIHALWPALSTSGLAGLFERGGDGLFGPGAVDETLCRPETRAALDAGRAVPPERLTELWAEVERLRGEMRGLFADHDVLLTPAAAALPWPVDTTHPALIDGQAVGPRGHAVFTTLANAAGLPAVALPCGWHAGLPLGLQLVGRPGADGSLLALAAEFESASTASGLLPHWPLWSPP